MKSKSSHVAALRASVLVAPVLLGISACKPESAAPTPAPAPAAPQPAASKAEPQASAPETKAKETTALTSDALQKALADAEPAPAPLPDVVAVVEGQEIKKEELEQAFKTVLAGQGIPADQLPAAQKAQGYKMLLNELIVEKIVTLRSAATEIKDEEVNSRLEMLKSRFPNPEAFESQLAKSGQNLDKLRDDIRNSLRAQAWIEDQIKGRPTASEAEAKDFYEKNPHQFEKPEQVRARHILLSVASDATPEVVAEKQKAAEAIITRIKGGEAFDKLATELSEDPSAKQNHGDLDFFSKEQMVPEFSNAAFGMKKGELSAPVRSQFGFHIIEVTDHKDAEKMTLESVKPQLIIFLDRRIHDEHIEKLLKELREKAQVEIKLP